VFAGELPLLPIRRVLVPGTRAALACPRDDLRPGETVVAALAATAGSGAPVGSVGTLADLEEVRVLGPEASWVRLRGSNLVRLSRAEERRGRWWATVVEVPEGDREAGPLVAAAQRALRRYLATRAEAGERVDLQIELSCDPVAASHEVASYLRISWPEVQEILEAGGAAERLNRARAVLERETELLRRLLGREGA